MSEPVSNADELRHEIERLRAELAAEQSDRSATEEIARQRGAVINALCADIADLKTENAALKAKPDPLAEMWAALEEYQPQADSDGHGESWKRMCEERTSCAADTARTVARRVARAATAGIGREATREVAAACAADTAFDASWDAKRAAAWAANAIALIRQAKEGQ
jgi:cob(I)alamin adenosyltransferase